jgi:4-hydroxythreonine-4-phosphate dehydrogenase
MGDPAGVGPEIALKALSNADLVARFRPVLVGYARVFREAAALLGDGVRLGVVQGVAELADLPAGTVAVREPRAEAPERFPRGRIDPVCGEAAYQCIATSIGLALEGAVDAVVTNPIHKKALNLAGHHYEGHTEIFRHLTGAARSAMMLLADGLCVVHVSTHCSLREAVERCRSKRILEVTRLAHEAMRRLGIERPRVGMAALNPHAGDSGLFGDEEEREIAPAVRAARREGIDVSDPLPADTIFSLARGGRFDVVVVQYHDQGHIPVKLLGFRYDDVTGRWASVEGVNVTLGLPILRVSVDHGTAFDQAWQGTADCTSLENAIEFALRMTADGPPAGGPCGEGPSGAERSS